MISKQFFLFLISGGVAAGLNWSSRFIFSMFFSFNIAIVLAFIVGLLSGFVLMRVYVFNSLDKSIFPQFSKYIIVNFFALLQTLLISIILLRWVMPSLGVVEYAEALSHLVGVLLPVVTSYIGHKLITFRKQ